MFTELNTAKEEISEFLALYAKFQAGARWLVDRQAKGLDNTPHLADFGRLEAQIDKAWESMAGADRDSALLVLAKKKAVPQEVLEAKELFSGELISIT